MRSDISPKNTNSLISLAKAVYGLKTLDIDLTAGSYSFDKHMLCFLVILVYLAYGALDLLIICLSLISIMQCLLKIVLICKSLIKQYYPSRTFVIQGHPDIELPMYTIMIPLYMEAAKMQSIVQAIEKIDYPLDKLDVKLILEEDDLLTSKVLALCHLPKHFQVIRVPSGGPRTKPKALNYAMQYILGQYVVIFDAEDSPDPKQLRNALNLFSISGPRCICVQAKLNFYNINENLLTGLQSIEYALWFNYLLPGLNQFGQFLPLGGTSCHFKVQELKKIGLWDPFNVTEDLDLGIRICLNGYQSVILESYTLEEAILTIPAWLRQRSRWIKGFIQSYIVFCYNRRKFNLSIKQMLVIDIFVGFSSLNFLIPIHFCLIGQNGIFIKEFLGINAILSLLYLIFSAALIATRSINKSNLKYLVLVFLFPFYFILHTVASYMVVFDLIWRPFSWNKTMHGLSKML